MDNSRLQAFEMAGSVAGHVAHDINNLLTPLMSCPVLIRHEVKENALVGEYLDIIEAKIGEMQKLTRQLQAFARVGRCGATVFDFNEAISGVITVMKGFLPRGITITLDLAEPRLNVEGNRAQIATVIENLVQNAADAGGPFGGITVKTEKVHLDTPLEGLSGSLSAGDYVKLTVTDTGTGVPDDIRGRIFDPFFTTRKASKPRGAGLGLSIVLVIVLNHLGGIDLKSRAGMGSSFSVYLPQRTER